MNDNSSAHLYRTAVISSLIFAFFELPLFYLINRQVTFNFGFAIVFITLLTLSIWVLNILLISINERYRRFNRTWIRFLVSCIIAAVFVAITYLILPVDDLLNVKKPWFIFLLVNMFALNVVFLRINIVRTKKRQMERELTSLRIQDLEAQQQQLKQQLGPHFLFNSLSTLKSLIKANPTLAEEYLIKLSDFLRISISANNENVIRLADEIRFTGYYVDMQQIRFSGSFLCQMQVPNDVAETRNVPIFAVQSLVENAIKHNTFSEDNPLVVRITVQGDELKVSNNKSPRLGLTAKSGTGLQNLRRRYALVANADLAVLNTADQFSVTIKLLHEQK